MKKKYFICSDVHGMFTAMKTSLREAGFNIADPSHILVIAGDLFDRGFECKELYDYITTLMADNRALVTKGNHELMLEMYLDGNEPHLSFFNYQKNGMEQTIFAFSGVTNWFDWAVANGPAPEDRSDENMYDLWCTYMEFTNMCISASYPGLRQFLADMPNYIELKNTVITHGMVAPQKDWRNPMLGWDSCHWAKPNESAYMRNMTEKNVYVGHMNAGLIRKYFGENENDNSLYTRPNGDVTYLDAMSIMRDTVNVAVVEDEALPQ